MKNILLSITLLMVMSCERKFEPDLRGWKAYAVPGKPLVHLDLDGRGITVGLLGDTNSVFRYPQWTKFNDQLLLTQIVKTQRCYDYQIIAIDTTGAIVDTIYTAPPNTSLNFKLAANDSLLILKTYHDDCEHSSDHTTYTFYNRYSKNALSDTITVGNARGIHFNENVWSPDSKKVIISKWSEGRTKAFTYDLVTKDTTYIGKGRDFTWSPTDNNLVAYIKDYSIYFKNIETRKEEVIFTGKEKRSAVNFRFNPNGEFLMIHVANYLLNVDLPILRSTKIIYYSLRDKTESTTVYDNQRIDTWKDSD
jgi:hypothetical protein